MERGHLWRSAFKTNLGMLELNLPGLDTEKASARPAPGVNSPRWIMGHLVLSRRGLLRLLGRPQPSDPRLEAFARGSDGEGSGPSWDELLVAFGDLDGALKEAFQAVVDWDRPTPNPGLHKEQPLEQVVAFLYMHESYHLGQIGMIRKLVGLEGGVA